MSQKNGSERVVMLLLAAAAVVVVAVVYFGRTPPAPGPEPGAKPGGGAKPAGAVGRGHSFQYKGPMPTAFHEAPELAALVKEGKLPPVDERLPKEPLVVPVVERIGKYGGTWRRAFTGPADGQNIDRLQHDHVIYYDLDGYTLVPHIAKSWEVKDGGRVFEFKLRKGMKWSDGHPFTADDFVFAHNDILLDDELVPVKPMWMRPGGKICEITKVDETTFRYTFAESYYVFPDFYGSAVVAGQSAAGRSLAGAYAPAHYLKQFHRKYVSEQELKKKVKEAGLDNWVQLLKQRSAADLNRNLPVVGPWKMVEPITGQLFTLERNPYYWAVDPEGNQLPYIDRITMHLTQNLEVLNLRAIRGDIDMQHRHIQLAKVPVLKQNADQGNYRVLFWRSQSGSACGIFLNQTYEADPEVGRWFRNKDFRIALSHGVDREAINELVFLGTGTPRAFLCAPDSPYYPGPEYENLYATLDPKKANAVLDRIGLAKKDGEGFRLRSDGKGPLVLTVAVTGDAFFDYPGAAELLAEQWAKIGLKIHVSVEERSVSGARGVANEQQITLWETGASDAPFFTAPVGTGCAYAPMIGAWYDSGGEKGVEPTGIFRQMLDLYEKSLVLPPEQRIELGRKLWGLHAENLFVIGTVGRSPAFNGVVVVKNNFRNVPDEAPNNSLLQNPGPARPEQFFFDGN
ncbi:MAG: ABC transporter substrate-binding protein [Planctomycetota bacterium]